MTKTPPRLNDLRLPNIERVPKGSYLITGLPRIRSAWLAALLSTDAVPCFHEAPTRAMAPIDEAKAFGLCDPGAACLYPNAAIDAFGAHLIIIIARDPAHSRRALEKFAGQAANGWDDIMARYQYFEDHANAVYFSFRDLNDFKVVSDIYWRCTRSRLSRKRFDLFDGLRIEQDIVKRAQHEANAA